MEGTEKMPIGRRSVILAVVVVLSAIAQAFGFNFERYQPADLDTLLAQRRPAKGVDLYPALPLKLTVTLAGYGENCQTDLVMRAMRMSGAPKDQIETVKVTTCINIRSATGKALRVFIQDGIAGFLPKEVPLGKSLTLYVVHLFTDTNGPGLLVNEFKTGEGGDVQRSEKLPSHQKGSWWTLVENVAEWGNQ
jgi:hypothetical protein